MVKTSSLLLSLLCTVAVVQSATPEANVVFPAHEARRLLKGSGGRPSGGGGRPSSGNRPSSGGTGASSTVIIVGGGGYYHTNSNVGSTTNNQNPSTAGATQESGTWSGSQGDGSLVLDPDVYVAAPDVVLPSSGALTSITASVVGATMLVLVTVNAL